jgi:hypothetical protein
MKNKMIVAVLGICSALTATAFATEVDFDRGSAVRTHFEMVAELVPQAPQPAAAEKSAAAKTICRDAFVTMMSEPTENAIPNLKKTFEGINTADQSACRMNISYAETPEKRGGVYVEVLNSPLDPFNHYVPASNEDASCSAANTSVNARHSWTQPSGWHYRFTTELSIKKLQNGMLEVTYSQDNGPELRCVGTIR